MKKNAWLAAAAVLLVLSLLSACGPSTSGRAVVEEKSETIRT
ncbi:MAG: hypothetical protein ACXW3H_07895 [Candidatus Aminicenantales bacterium]